MYQTFNVAGSIFVRAVFVLSNFFTQHSIKLSLYFIYLYEAVFILVLYSFFVLINRKIGAKWINSINLKFFKRLGLAFLVVYLMNLGMQFLTKNEYESATENYVNQIGGIDYLGERLLYIELMSGIFSIIKGALVV